MSDIETVVKALVQQTVSALLPQIVQHVQSQVGAPAPLAATATISAVTPTPAPVADAFGGLGVATPAPAATAVTAEMVQALIMPLVSNDTFKAQLTAEMNAMGIANLPDAKPEQLPELYARFQRVAAGAGAAQPVAAAVATPSII